MKHTEVEFKYRADNIKIQDFMEVCVANIPVSHFTAAGFDYFYSNKDQPDSFFRYRVGPDINQLTLKKKKSDLNSIVRVEHNVDLGKEMTRSSAEAFIKEFGYEPCGSLYKNCFGFSYTWYVMVYYVCYNSNMEEIGRFIEIEAREDYDWKSEEDALTAITVLEKLCATKLGLSSKNRIKRSLFEIFGKDTNG